MKNLSLLLLLLSTIGYSQQGYVSATFDVRNATFGSAPTENKPEPNTNFKLAMVGNKGTEAGIGLELFPRIDYNRYYLFLGQQIKLSETLKLVPSLEPSIINRWGSWGKGLGYEDNRSSHLTLGASLALRVKITDKLFLENQFSALPSTDLAAKYDDFKVRYSYFIGLGYGF